MYEYLRDAVQNCYLTTTAVSYFSHCLITTGIIEILLSSVNTGQYLRPDGMFLEVFLEGDEPEVSVGRLTEGAGAETGAVLVSWQS